MSGSCAGCGMALDAKTAVQGLCPACLLRTAIAIDRDEPQYTILTLLSEGSRSTTFLARDASDRGDYVAFKLLHQRGDEPSILARFDCARSALTTLRHPGIARLLHIGSNDEGRVFVATEFVPGTPLATAAAGPLPLDDRIAIGRQLRSSVEAAHRAGVLHLALEPARVRVTRSGDQRIAKVIGFGLAAVIDEARGTERDDLEALERLLAMLGTAP